MPVVVALSDQKVRDAITVTNNGSERITTHVDVVSWTQSDGKDIFGPTSDVLFNPGMFTLEPGQEQVVRLGWRQTSQLNSERTYRIMFREVPPPLSTNAPPTSPTGELRNQLRMLLELRVPIYVSPYQTIHQSNWTAKYLDGKRIEVQLKNQGNLHTVIHSLQLTSASGVPIGAPLNVHSAVLSGQSRTWTLSSPQADKEALAVEVRADQLHKRLSIAR